MNRSNCTYHSLPCYCKLILLLTCLEMLFPTVSFATDVITDSITQRFRKQLLLFPQEKIFLHTDRSSYIAGDTIWLRAHLVDAATHHALTVSRYIYVELINTQNKLQTRIKLRPEKDSYHGYIRLDDMLPQGYYTLRAYTRLMESMPENYFFHSTIAIVNPIGKAVNEATTMYTSSHFDVGFFPEGGYLPAGLPWRVAFKGINHEGWSDQVYGQVIERESGDTVATFTHSHRGMGTFLMKAESGKEYVAQVFNSQNRYQEFELPLAIDNASVLSTHWVKGKLAITSSTPHKAGMQLILHSRGLIFYNRPWNPNQSTLYINKEQMPAGIIQVLLADSLNQILSERLVFNRPDKELQTILQTDKEEYRNREAVTVQAMLNAQLTDTLKPGNFSVSVCLEEDARATSPASIYTYLLLTSELQGNIELPETYFKNNDKEAEQNLDLLMMTQGWRRYNIPQVAQGEYRRPHTRPEIGQEIHGQVISEFSRKPRPQAPVLMIISGIRFYEEKVADSLGRFSFTHLEFPDSTRYIVRGLSRRGRSHDIEITLQQESFPDIPAYASHYNLLNRSEVERELNINALNDSTIRVIALEEVNIVGRRLPKNIIPNNASSTTYGPDFIAKKHAYDMYELLNSIPRVSVVNGTIGVRGGSSYGSNMRMKKSDVATVVNGEERSINEVLQMRAADVESITVMKNATNTQWGFRNIGTLIIIQTKPGSRGRNVFEKVNIAGYTPLGYQKPVAFYSPKYTPNTLVKRDQRRTLHWEPCVRFLPDGKASFQFYTGDRKGTYTILIQGVTIDGQIIHAQKQFTVK